MGVDCRHDFDAIIRSIPQSTTMEAFFTIYRSCETRAMQPRCHGYMGMVLQLVVFREPG